MILIVAFGFFWFGKLFSTRYRISTLPRGGKGDLGLWPRGVPPPLRVRGWTVEQKGKNKS
jgi:hypothetical protein